MATHPSQWDVDSLDWKDYGVDSIIHTVLDHKHLGNGSIILCHNGAKYTAEALEQLIDGLQSKGFTLVKMSDLIYKDHYDINPEGLPAAHQIAKKNVIIIWVDCYVWQSTFLIIFGKLI